MKEVLKYLKSAIALSATQDNKKIDLNKDIRTQECTNIRKCLVQYFSAKCVMLPLRYHFCSAKSNHACSIPSTSQKSCSSAMTMIIPFHSPLLLQHCPVKHGHYTTDSKEATYERHTYHTIENLESAASFAVDAIIC
jgi:hypothetical protein